MRPNRRAAAQLLRSLPGLPGSAARPGCLGGRSLAGDAGGGAAAAAAPPPLAPGAVFTLTKCYSAADVAAFVALTGDSNPIHVDSGAAAAVGLATPILPGLLLAALFPAIIGSHFPGALYLSQTLKFKQYAPVGEAFTAALTVERASGSRVSFLTVCRNTGSGEVVVEGTALALIKAAAVGGDGGAVCTVRKM